MTSEIFWRFKSLCFQEYNKNLFEVTRLLGVCDREKPHIELTPVKQPVFSLRDSVGCNCDPASPCGAFRFWGNIILSHSPLPLTSWEGPAFSGAGNSISASTSSSELKTKKFDLI